MGFIAQTHVGLHKGFRGIPPSSSTWPCLLDLDLVHQLVDSPTTPSSLIIRIIEGQVGLIQGPSLNPKASDLNQPKGNPQFNPGAVMLGNFDTSTMGLPESSWYMYLWPPGPWFGFGELRV